MKSYKITHKNKTYIVKAKDSIDAIKKIEEVQDERLSPMTYRKLKEFGYTSNQWKNLSQEQANKIVASHEQKKANTSKKESTQTKQQKSAETKSGQTVKSQKLLENKRYGSKPELDKLVDSGRVADRLRVAKYGYGLDRLIKDRDATVRRAVAEQGYGLDKLVNDTNPEVRCAVAFQGYGLDKLVNDKKYWVRMAVAEQGYGLNKLANDENIYVREIAKRMLENQKETRSK